MILLHGALGAAAQFAELSSRFEAGSAHTFDFAGHGADAPPNGPLTVERLAAQLEEYVEARALRGSPCFGYSMGGYVALVVAATSPGLLGPVTTFATKLAWTPEAAGKESAQLDPETIHAKVPKFAALLESRHGSSGWRPLCVSTAALMRDLGAHPLLDATALARISTPVKLMVGDRDPVVTIDETVAAYRALANGQLAVLPGLGHPLERVPTQVLLREILSAG
jgi:pimeloyl-ACP methyl ester carboxylesterase